MRELGIEIKTARTELFYCVCASRFCPTRGDFLLECPLVPREIGTRNRLGGTRNTEGYATFRCVSLLGKSRGESVPNSSLKITNLRKKVLHVFLDFAPLIYARLFFLFSLNSLPVSRVTRAWQVPKTFNPLVSRFLRLCLSRAVRVKKIKGIVSSPYLISLPCFRCNLFRCCCFILRTKSKRNWMVIQLALLNTGIRRFFFRLLIATLKWLFRVQSVRWSDSISISRWPMLCFRRTIGFPFPYVTIRNSLPLAKNLRPA